ncbi:unnamed protein product, partial [Rotaria sp. Silwood1]
IFDSGMIIVLVVDDEREEFVVSNNLEEITCKHFHGIVD